ncbi:toll-like receptor 10 [Mercenaria mercenaria]|uniref:toll-like receptor 10 n=1 Tax=Mercenaria mercenaria TaxID=6596 RepID=UPI00234F9E9D|nr:toll-like receptor 10 [Mercenaria mercenaria]
MKATCLNIVLLLAGIAATSCTEDSYWCKPLVGGTLQCNHFPNEILAGISEVKIVEFMEQYNEVIVNSSCFESETWSKVTHLTLDDRSVDNGDRILKFQAKCFIQLDVLQELHVHVARQIRLEPDAFLGLNFTKVLDFSECGRLSLGELSSAIGSANIKSLERLEISSIGTRNGAFEINRDFFEALANTNIKHIDMSKNVVTQFRPFQLHLLEKLEVLNLSNSPITDISLNYNNSVKHSTLYKSLKVLDLSHINLPRFEFLIEDSVQFIDVFRVSHISYFLEQVFSIRSINGSGILKQTLEIRILNFTVANDIQWLLQEINLSKNNLIRLDVQIYCGNHTANRITMIDLAENNLEFLHPSILSFMPRIETLDLSNNLLNKMMDESDILFENLLSSLLQLKSISLSANNLLAIPKNMFVKNVDLETVDLSSNSISQVTFTLSHAKKLKFLDLRNNEIKFIDETSIELLNSISTEKCPEAIVNLQDNPVSCSECKSERFLTWLLQTKIINPSKVKCIGENGNRIKVTNAAIELVQQICERQKVLIATSVSAGTFVLLVIIFITFVYKRWTQIRKKRNRKSVLQLLQNGQGKFEFVAFLSYSSSDEEFVESNVYYSLRDNLKLQTGIQRELVCSGDRFLRPGFFVLDETIRCIEKSAVIIIVLSNDFCTSNYCHNELEQAIQLQRPIILMIKGTVDEELMKPRLKLLYKENVRILWTEQNGQYVLKTTWENVCSSVLDLIAFNL